MLARRQGDAWYLGGITNWTKRELRVPLDFLGVGQFAAKLYVDGSMDEARPNELAKKEQSVESTGALAVSLAPGGGFVAKIAPADGK